MSGVILSAIRRIATPKGDVLHGIKTSDPGFCGFGEAYFSFVHQGAVKGWKRHRRMTLNLICPVGAVRVVVHDGDPARNAPLDVTLSAAAESCLRLTVPPLYWVAFQGLGDGENLLLNVASCPHDPDEAEVAGIDVFPWSWT